MKLDEIYLASDETKSTDTSLLSDVSDDMALEIVSETKTMNAPHKAKRIEEIPEPRESNLKVFRMNDGTEQAVFSPSAIHMFYDETHTFENVENTLIEDEGGRHFSCGKNHFVAKFSNEEDNDAIFSIEHGMQKVTVCARKTRKIKNNGVKTRLHKKNKKGIRSADILTLYTATTATTAEPFT